MQNKIEDIKRHLLKEFSNNPSLLVGCKTGKWFWAACGYDIIIFTNNVRGYLPKVFLDDIVNVYFYSLEELENKKNYELKVTLSTAYILNDPNLSLGAHKEEIMKMKGEIFYQSFEEEILRLLRNLTYAEEAYSLGAYASSAFWITNLGYDISVALNLLNKVQTSPSHLMQQIKENTIFKETNYFVSVANFLGLEYATTTSHKRIFSTLETFKKIADLYNFRSSQPTGLSSITDYISDIRNIELQRKCTYALEQRLPLNTHIISTKWYIDLMTRLYETICTIENISQFKPNIVEELEKRRRDIASSGTSLLNGILQEITPTSLVKSIEEARRVVYWLKKTKV